MNFAMRFLYFGALCIFFLLAKVVLRSYATCYSVSWVMIFLASTLMERLQIWSQSDGLFTEWKTFLVLANPLVALRLNRSRAVL